MFIDFLYGIIGIFILTAYCIPGAFLVPKIAYWVMTPYITMAVCIAVMSMLLMM